MKNGKTLSIVAGAAMLCTLVGCSNADREASTYTVEEVASDIPLRESYDYTVRRIYTFTTLFSSSPSVYRFTYLLDGKLTETTVKEDKVYLEFNDDPKKPDTVDVYECVGTSKDKNVTPPKAKDSDCANEPLFYLNIKEESLIN